MNRSEQINELAAALSKAQGAMENAAKAKVNPHFKSKYADLSSVWDAIREPLSKNGLSVLQLPEMDEAGNVRINTILMHASGQFIEASYALPPMQNTAQGLGSAITYMKRYALSGVGVAPEDDDGNAATSSAAPEPVGNISDLQVSMLRALIERTGADTAKFCEYMRVDSLPLIAAKDFARAVSALEAKAKPKNSGTANAPDYRV